MASMSYCAFQNARDDIRNKLDNLEYEGSEDEDGLSSEEREAAITIIELAERLEHWLESYA